MREDRNMPALSALAFDIGGQITHIGDHIPWPPGPPALASLQAGGQKLPFGNIGRSHPTDQWHEQYAASILRKPESQAMFFVTDKPRALSSLEAAYSLGCAISRILCGAFFWSRSKPPSDRWRQSVRPLEPPGPHSPAKNPGA